MVAAAGKEGPFRVRKETAFYLSDASPLNIGGQVVLFGTGHLAGMTPDTFIHMEMEAGLHFPVINSKSVDLGFGRMRLNRGRQRLNRFG